MQALDGTTSTGWSAMVLRTVASEAAAFARLALTMPLRSLAASTLHDVGSHPVPVVLVHGIFGDATNFVPLRRHLARHGIRRFSSFAYLPRLDYPRLADELGRHIGNVCRDVGTTQVDVVGHSLGGLVARYYMQSTGTHLVRRLVTLGTPYLPHANAPHELAVFGNEDPIVPPPSARRRTIVLDGCAHLGLLTDERALDAVVAFLGRPAAVPRRATPLAA